VLINVFFLFSGKSIGGLDIISWRILSVNRVDDIEMMP